MALDAETQAAVRDAIDRVLSGREQVPGDLPYPPSIRDYVFAAVWTEDDEETRRKREWTKPGRRLSRVVQQVYVAGWFAGRACDEQVARQIRDAIGIQDAEAANEPHPYIGVAACLVCDQPPDHEVHVVRCQRCNGNGMVAAGPEDANWCPECGGEGWVGRAEAGDGNG